VSIYCDFYCLHTVCVSIYNDGHITAVCVCQYTMTVVLQLCVCVSIYNDYLCLDSVCVSLYIDSHVRAVCVSIYSDCHARADVCEMLPGVWGGRGLGY